MVLVLEDVLLGLHERARHSHWWSWQEAVGRSSYHVDWLLSWNILADLAHFRGVIAHYLHVLNATMWMHLLRIHHLLPIEVIVGSYWLLHFELLDYFKLCMNIS